MALPNIYADTPVAIAPSGDIFVTSHETGEIYKLDAQQTLSLYASIDGEVSTYDLCSHA